MLYLLPLLQGLSRRCCQRGYALRVELGNCWCRNSSRQTVVACLPGSLSRAIAPNRERVLIKTMPLPTARQIALQILHTLETQHAYTDVVLRHVLRQSTLERRDRAFVTDCVYGVMRWRAENV